MGRDLRCRDNLLHQPAPRVLLSGHKICHLKRDLRRLDLITKSKKPALPGFAFLVPFIVILSTEKAFSKCVRYASRIPSCGDKPICFFFFSFFFSEAPCQTQLPLLTLIVILFLYYPISSSFTVNFLTFVLIQITEVIYMLTALSCFSSSLTSPPYFLPFLSPIDKGLTSS